VDIHSLSAQQLRIVIDAQPVSQAALSVTSTGLSLTTTPGSGLPDFVRRKLADLELPVEVATGLLALGSAGVLVRAIGRGRPPIRYGKLAVGAAVSVMYAAPYLVEWVSQHASLVFMLPGDDWRTYEGYARDIREHSLLMLQGATPGHAVPFYFQPLYPYWLALLHTLTGESVQAAVLAQQVAVVVAIVLIATTLPDHRGYLAGMLFVFATGIVVEWFRLGTFLLSENLLLLVFAALLAGVGQLERRPAYLLLVLIGALLGVGILTRTTTWLAVPVVLWIVCRAAKPSVTMRRAAVAAVPLILVITFVPIRNYFAAGSATPVPTSTTPYLYVALVPESHYDTAPTSGEAGIGGVVRAVLKQPGAVARQRLLNLAYVLGFPRSLSHDDVPLIFAPLFLLWLLAPLGLLWRPRSKVALVSLALALTHCLALVIIWPNSYYYRMVIPATLPLAVWDIFVVAQLFAGLPEPSWLGSRLRQRWPGPPSQVAAQLDG